MKVHSRCNGDAMSPSDHSLLNCPASCLMSKRISIAFCSSDKSPLAYALFKVWSVGIHNTCSNAFCGVFHPIWVSRSAGVAPFSSCYRKLLDETVKTFAVFPRGCTFSMDGEDNCMLSVPFSSRDLHYSSRQGGRIYQVLTTGALTLGCHVFMVSMKVYCSVLPTRLSPRCLPSSPHLLK